MRWNFIVPVLALPFAACSEDPSKEVYPAEIQNILGKLETIKKGEGVYQALQHLGLEVDMYNQDDSLVFLDAENPEDHWWLFDLGVGNEWLIEVATVLDYEPGPKSEDLKYSVLEIGICRGSVNAWRNDRGWEFGLKKVFPRWWRGKIYVSEKELEAAKNQGKAEQVASWKGL
jgi:hypothetical protein